MKKPNKNDVLESILFFSMMTGFLILFSCL